MITNERIRHGLFQSVPDLKAAILDYIDQHNPIVQAIPLDATADSILGKVAAICNALR